MFDESTYIEIIELWIPILININLQLLFII